MEKFGANFGLNVDDDLVNELSLCVFSLAQFTQYNDKRGRGAGELKLFIGNDNSLVLTTTEGQRHSLYVCYAKFGSFIPCRTIDDKR